MPKSINVTEKELVELMEFCKQPISLAFGPGWTALQWPDDTPMPEAVERLGYMRGVLNENCDGAGI